MSAGRGRAVLASWLAAVALSTVVLTRAASGPLAPPPLGRPEAWADWVAGRDAVVAALALLRIAALAVAWYLLAVTVAGGLLRAVRARRLVGMADVLTVPVVRRVLVAAAGVTLVPTTPALAVAPGRPPAAVALAQPGPTAPPEDRGPPPTLTMRLLPEGAEVPGPPRAEPAPSIAPAADSAPSTWRVEAGQCFWSIAEDVLIQAHGRAPTDPEVVPYWQALIEANRATLADPDNPHLIFPGQVFTVPAPPP